MRVDFSFESGTTTQIVQRIVSNAVSWGANTIYPYAWSTFYGVSWNTSNPLLAPTSKGVENILPVLVNRAHSNGLKVIAWCQPANAPGKGVFTNDALWRQVRWDGTYHTNANPTNSTFLLSPYNTNFIAWMDGLIDEVLDLGVDGIDVSETYVNKDKAGGGSLGSTFDSEANKTFSNRYPTLVLNSGTAWEQPWMNLRTEITTSNIFARIGRIVNGRGREYHVTFNWDHDTYSGVLKSAESIEDNFGFSFNQIMNLADDARPEFVCPQVNWQADVTNRANTLKSAEWTTGATIQVVGFASNRVIVSAHVEFGKVGGTVANPAIWPTVLENQTALSSALTNAAGADFYMHKYPSTNPPLAAAVSNVFRGVP
jgi:hypothetical protein